MKVITLIIIVVLIAVVPIAGYVKNIARLIDCDFASPYKAEILRGVGVVMPPVGMIMGYCDIEDGAVK